MRVCLRLAPLAVAVPTLEPGIRLGGSRWDGRPSAQCDGCRNAGTSERPCWEGESVAREPLDWALSEDVG